MSNYRKTMADALREMYPLTEETQLDEGVFDPKDGEKWAKEIQKGIKAPVVDVKTSSLGGEESMSIMVKFSMEKEASKGGTAFFNSRYANVRVDIDGSMEMFQASHKFGIKKMRKAKIKSAKDVIKKINDWIVKVPSLKEEVDLDEFTKKDFDSNEDQNMHTENAVELARKFGTSKEYDQMVAIYKTHMKKGEISRSDQMKRDALVKKYLPKLKEEVDLDEAILKDRDYEVDEKEGVVKISKKNFAKVSKDAKGTDKSKPTMMVLTKKGTSLYPVKFTEEVGLDEDASNFKSAVARIKKAKSAKDLKKLEKSFERVYKQTGALTDKEFGQLDDMISDKLVKLGEEVDLDKLPDMRDALRQVRAEEADLDEATMSSSQIARLKKSYEPMRDKKISVSNADKLSAMMDKVGKDKEALIQLFKADIPFVSQSAVTKLITKHNMKGAEINKLREEVDLDEGKMSQLHQYIKDKKSAEEIAKLMKLDVKTVKALMNSHHPEEVEESAASDARRAMRRDKDFSRRDSADDDTDASDDDVKGASKNIMMQMRKAQSLSGNFAVEFGDGKKVKIPAKMAIAVQQKYNAMRKPADKEKFQARIGKSYKDMLSALKEELQPKKESILERMNRKIKENKDG